MVTKTKAWVSALAMIAVALQAAFSDDVFGWDDTSQFIATVVTAIAGVYAVYKAPRYASGTIEGNDKR